MAKTPWSIAGEEIASCNCAWGCPCQFNALPTTGRCEAFVAWRIDNGHFGDTSLDGLVFASVLWFPGPGPRREREGPPHRRQQSYSGPALSYRSALKRPAWGRRLRDLLRRHAPQTRHRFGADHIRVPPRGSYRQDQYSRCRRNEDRAYQEPGDGRDAPRPHRSPGRIRVQVGGGREHRCLRGELRRRLLQSCQYLRPTQPI